MIKRAAIIGLGLIGGSLGMALLQGKIAQEVAGYDRERKALEKALEMGAINHLATSSQEAVQGAELVILAVPVGVLPSVAREIAPYLSPQAIVTDTGSTKAKVVHELETIFPSSITYIGGHPMTGSERAGISAADRYLLENAVYILTPTTRTSEEALSRLKTILTALGARVICLPPEKHDWVVGVVSHLPHFLAVSLMHMVARYSLEHRELLMLAAGGFRDTTRIASGHPIMWRDIYLSNAQVLLNILEAWEQEIRRLATLIREHDGQGLLEALEYARSWRNQIPARQKGLLPTLHEIVITVPDRPGVIGFVGQILGQEGINISDIEILRVREGEGGSIRLGFTSSSAAEQALQVLRRHGITARWRE
ncbi:prephenate dehydrogenase [Thermanaeromonas toyohensis ToBE]|uniref:Prephenate dehydrogenase n=1 Tax=Thermanaeromonas toyohensis ToBE TaxID=698762 RepID=A0A1W1VY69_9FIRM|nr:prephenate dehydrogenase [Thermanaeromonas toyohensis]SMB98332.1 prephenate dehydrogenase [Thermanaeromonas toyohensis ToBE]